MTAESKLFDYFNGNISHKTFGDCMWWNIILQPIGEKLTIPSYVVVSYPVSPQLVWAVG